MLSIKNKRILLTGGTGSFGKSFVNYLLKKNFKFKKIIIFSRDELKQYEFRNTISNQHKKKVGFFLGDVRDKERLELAIQDVDIVIHAAALKQVEVSEYNPMEFIKTNIIGAQNLIEACLRSNVQKLVALSTDKASSPINLYGATKLCSDKLFLAANNIKGKKKINFSIVRYGNVIGSRGSVIPLFKQQSKNCLFTVTHKEMTRFLITMDKAIQTVLKSISLKYPMILVPKLPSVKILDLCKSINPKAVIKIIGIRPGEKIHEELVSYYESYNTIDLGNFYGILGWSKHNKKQNSKPFIYSSDKNKIFLSVKQIKKIINTY